MKSFKRIAVAVAIAGTIIGGTSACMSGNQSSSTVQKTQQKVSNAEGTKLIDKEPYPIAQMNDSDERANLIERLLRLNDPNKVGYLYELNNANQPTGYYVIRGKVSDADSQLTNTQQIVQPCGGCDRQVVDSIGDDGSYGPAEDGIFFFTSSNVLVEYNGKYQYSDAPLNVKGVPLLIEDGAKPTTDLGNNK